MNDDNGWFSFCVGFIMGSIVISILIVTLTNGLWKDSAINRGFAYYHPKTAEFIWKTNMVEKVEVNK